MVDHEVTINSVDISSYVLSTGWIVTLDTNNPDGNRAQIDVSTNIFDVVSNLQVGDSVLIKRGVDSSNLNVIFRGAIERYDISGGNIRIECRDPLWRLRYKIVTKSYDSNIDASAGKISAIAEDLITTQAGLSASVVDSGTTFTLSKFICNDEDIRERLYTLAKVLNYSVFYNHVSDTVNFEPAGTSVYSYDLEVGVNIAKVPNWIVDKTNMRNKFKVKGAVRRGWQQEKFDGDDSTTQFTLSFVPKDTQITVDGALKTRGESSAQGTYDYSVDEDNKQINFVNAPASGSNNVVVDFSHDIPIPIIARNQDSITAYGQQDGAQYFDDLKSISDAEVRATKIIEQIGVPFNRTTLNTTNVHNLNIANQVHVIDAQQGKELDLTIQKIIYNFPSGQDIIDVGDEDFKMQDFVTNVAQRLRALEREQLTDVDLLTNIFDFSNSATPKQRWFKLLKRDVESDSIWGVGFNNTAGTAVDKNWGGDGVWQGSYKNSPSTAVLIPGQKIFQDYGWDSEFLDASSTGTWDTSTYDTFKKGKLTLADGEVILTKILSKGLTYTAGTVDLGTVTNIDNLTIELSFDNGSNYSSVSDGVRTLISDTDTNGVLLKLTSSGATVTVENTYLSVTGHTNSTTGEIIAPMIKINLEE